MQVFCFILTCVISMTHVFAQGSFAPNADTPGTSAIHKDSSVFVNWATGCEVSRGPQDIATLGSPLVSVGEPHFAIGISGANGVVSLGDGGSAILTFERPIINGSGWDFAVFENGFSNDYLELAFVEVSSDGINFFRFESTSEIQTNTQVGGFGLTNATEINNFAGKYRVQFGTPFDLEELDNIAGLDINNITHVKIIDVVGSIDPNFATYDAQGNIVNDPYTTDFPSGGFDLDAVGVIHEQPLSIDKNELSFTMYPNPTKSDLNIKMQGKNVLEILDVSGKMLFQNEFENFTTLNLSFLDSGIYWVKCNQSLQKLIVY